MPIVPLRPFMVVFVFDSGSHPMYIAFNCNVFLVSFNLKNLSSFSLGFMIRTLWRYRLIYFPSTCWYVLFWGFFIIIPKLNTFIRNIGSLDTVSSTLPVRRCAVSICPITCDVELGYLVVFARFLHCQIIIVSIVINK